MTNKTKILIAILIIAAVGVVIVGAVRNYKPENKTNKEQEQLNEIFDVYTNSTDETENALINQTADNVINEAVNNEANAKEESKETEKTEGNKKEEVVGKEEKESNTENTEETERQKAIDLAKKAWGISVDSYDFQTRLINDGIYEVTVISNDANRTTVAIYKVDTKTGVVSE